MRKQLRLLMLALMSIILLTGCNILGKQANIKLSAEYEALCNSKNTKNKQLCRETMNQLPKFENDVNTYFKEKFGIGDFVLTGINFPYGSFDHGGFNATFQLKSDRYVMITDTFDYKDGKYMIRARGESVGGETVLANGIIFSKYYKTLPLKDVENTLVKLGFRNTNDDLRYFSNSSGRYLNNKYLIADYYNQNIHLEMNEKEEIVKLYADEKKIKNYEKYVNEIGKTKKLLVQGLAINEEEAKQKFLKYVEFLEGNKEYEKVLLPEVYFQNEENKAEGFVISMYEKGKMKVKEQ